MKTLVNFVTFIVIILIAVFIVYPIFVLVLQKPADNGAYCASMLFGIIALSPVFFGTMLLRALFCRKKKINKT